VVVSAFVSAAVPAPDGDVRLGVVALALGMFAALTVNAAAVAGVAVLASLVFDGFLVNQFGVLAWHGAADGRRLGVLGVAALLGFVVGALWRRLRTWRLWYGRSAWLVEQARDMPGRDMAVRLDEQWSRPAALVGDAKEVDRG